MSKQTGVRLGLFMALAIASGVLLWAQTWVWAKPRPEDRDGTVQATLRVLAYRPAVLFTTREEQTEFRTFQQTQAALLRNPMVLEKALTDPTVATLPSVRQQDDPLEWLQENLKVEFTPEAELIEVSLGGDAPAEERVKLLTAVINAYNKNVVNIEGENRLQRLQYLEKLSGDYVDELKQKRERLRQLSEQFGMVPNRRDRLADEASSLRERTLFDLHLKEIEARTLLDRHKDRDDASALEDRLAVLAAQQKALEDERARAEDEARSHKTHAIDLQTEQEQVATLQSIANELNREIQVLKIELSAPPRVTVVSWPRLPAAR